MNFFRSEKMGFYNLIMPRESAWEILNELGELNCLEFIDENPFELSSKPYSKFVKRIEEMNFKLTFLDESAVRFKKNLKTYKKDIRLILHKIREFLLNRSRAEKSYFEEVESELDDKFKYLSEQVKQFDELNERKNKLDEYRCLLLKVKEVLGASIIFM